MSEFLMQLDYYAHRIQPKSNEKVMCKPMTRKQACRKCHMDLSLSFLFIIIVHGGPN